MSEFNIFETLYEWGQESLNEMAYPSNFNLMEFSELPTFKARKQYCDDRLQQLGKGSSRIVYKVDEEKALKIAFNQKGIAQNRAECDWGKNNYEVFGKVYNADTDNYYWIEMELARKATTKDFKTFFGVSFKDFCEMIKYIYTIAVPEFKKYFRYSDEIKSKVDDLLYNDEDNPITRLYQYISDYRPFTINDWLRIANWGIVSRNGKEHLVIIDDGFNQDVYDNYYARR